MAVPVALLEPVNIAGITVKRASLHNTAHVAALDLRIGDTVLVERRGDVIPQVHSVLHERRPRGAKPWQPPEHCTACGTPLELRTADLGSSATEPVEDQGTVVVSSAARPRRGLVGVEMLTCTNAACSGRQGRLLRHFAMRCIKGVGVKMVDDFVQAGLLQTPVDFYHLHERQDEVCSIHVTALIAQSVKRLQSTLCGG
jgi:DNA ligase (NAD+)